MHVLLIEPDYYTQYPPLGLLKLSAMHKLRGDTVQFIRGTAGLMSVHREPSKVYITSLFTWAWRPVHDAVHICKALFPRSEISVGGVYASLRPDHASTTGVRVHPGIFPDLEDILPDYEIVPEWHHKRRASIFFTHRGCIRKCKFCAVPALEGKPVQLRSNLSIRHLVHPQHDKAILWDNNILGEPNWQDVVGELAELSSENEKFEVDFNQGLDARLINEQVAEMLAKVRMPIVRVAYDFPGMGRSVKNAIEFLSAVGFYRRNIISYVLFNFEDSPEDLFTRVRDLLNWGASAYPMRFQPLDTLEKDSHIGPKWTKEQLEMVANARRVIGYGGAFPPYEGLRKKFESARNFEEAFGLWNPKSKKPVDKDEQFLFSDMARDHDYPLIS